MDDAYARFAGELAGVGQGAGMGALPHAGMGVGLPQYNGGMPMQPPMFPMMQQQQQGAGFAQGGMGYGQGAFYGGGTAGGFYGTGMAGQMGMGMGMGVPGPGPGAYQPPAGGGILASMRGDAPGADGNGKKKHEKKPKVKGGIMREAAGTKWRDPTLDDWPENDYRIFVGELGNELNDDALAKAFQKYPSFAKARIVKDQRTKKSKGFGFVSFLDSSDFAKALKEMNGKYIGNRPARLRKSNWAERNADVPQNKKFVKKG